MDDSKTSAYYRDSSRFKHPEISEATARAIIDNPVHVETQDNGRVRYYGKGTFRDGSVTMYIRVVTAPDGETILTAFPDSGFSRRMRRQSE